MNPGRWSALATLFGVAVLFMVTAGVAAYLLAIAAVMRGSFLLLLLSRIGITTKVEAMPLAVYFGKARAQEFGVALLGWGSLAADLALRSLAATPDAKKGHGTWNWAQYSNPQLDKLIVSSLATVDPAKREAAARAASSEAARDVAFIPLHYQIVTWAMKRSLDYAARTDEFTFAHRFRAVK